MAYMLHMDTWASLAAIAFILPYRSPNYKENYCGHIRMSKILSRICQKEDSLFEYKNKSQKIFRSSKMYLPT